jgi:hypothetical protein
LSCVPVREIVAVLGVDKALGFEFTTAEEELDVVVPTEFVAVTV